MLRISSTIFKVKKIIFISCLTLFFSSCIDPVTPEFEFKEGLVFVESIASTVPKASFATINRSIIEFGVYVVKFAEGATVSFENVATGEIVSLFETRNSYVPPEDFVVQPGEQWKLNIQLANGEKIESTPEIVLDPVPITNIEVKYDSELVFRDNLGGKFVPGHRVSIDFEDPANTENYYYWSYRAYENLEFCEKCVNGIWRDNECTPTNIASFRARYFDYSCDVDCWQIRFPEGVTIFDDRFSNGKNVNKLPVGDLLLYNKMNMVVEVQQYSLTPAAYDYFKVLKDVVDNNSGLNAPPPAALVGNLTNPDNDNDFVFGRFTAAATSTASVFINRTLIEDVPIDQTDPVIFEPQLMSPYPPPVTIQAPCSENRSRTAVRPLTWIDE